MRFAFVSIPEQGHFGPLLAPAALLKQQGHDVCVVSAEPARAKVEAAGLIFLSVSDDTPEEFKSGFDADSGPESRIRRAAGGFSGYELLMMKGILKAWQEETSRPDCVIADNCSYAGFDAAEHFNIPLVVVAPCPLSMTLDIGGFQQYNAPLHVPLEALTRHLSSSMTLLERYVLNPVLKRQVSRSLGGIFRQERNKARAQLGLKPLRGPGIAGAEPGVPRDLWLGSITWDLEVKRPLPPNFHLVGPTGCDFSVNFPPKLDDAKIMDLLESSAAAGRPVVYVAMGTAVVLKEGEVKAFAEGFAAVPEARFLWSLKEAQQAHLPSDMDPDQILVQSWVPQAAVLGQPAVKVFVSHGGMNSTNEAFAAGKPVLCLPFGADQPVNAQHIADKQVGLQLDPKGLKAADLAASLRRLLNEPGFGERAAAVGVNMRAHSGPATAARMVAAFAAGEPVVPEPATKGNDSSDSGAPSA